MSDVVVVIGPRAAPSGAEYRVVTPATPGTPWFTVQCMDTPDGPGYGVWEDVCSRDTLAEAVEVVNVRCGGVTFRVDGRVVTVGNDVRASVNLGDGRAVEVVLTHEGIIVDFFTGPDPNPDPSGNQLVLTHDQLRHEHVGTSSSTYGEAFDEAIGPVGEAWAIRSTEPVFGETGLWWSNDDGWGDANSRTEFPNTDGHLPIGGTWVKLT